MAKISAPEAGSSIMLQSFFSIARSWLGSHPARAVFLIAFLATAAVNPGMVGSDTFRRLQVTHWLWNGEPQVAPEDHEPSMNLPGRNGAVYPPYGIGQSIVMFPGDVVGTLATLQVHDPLIRLHARVSIMWYLTFPALTALAVLFGFLLVRELSYGSEVATLASMAMLFGSSVFHYAHNAQENNLMLLLLLGSCFYGLRWVKSNRPADAAATAGMLGYGLLVRPTMIASVLCVLWIIVLALRAALTENPMRRLRGLFVGISVFLLFAGIERLYNWYRFGDIFGTYIKVQTAYFAQAGGYAPGFPFGHAFWPGFVGPLLDVEKSVFIFDPLLLLALAVFTLPTWRSEEAARRVVAAAMMLLVATCAIYATSYWWPGDSSWGPRHHVLPVQLAVLAGAAAVFEKWHKLARSARLLVSGLILLAVEIQLSSVLLDYNLEVGQRMLSDSPIIVPIIRVANFIAIATGNFIAWGLDFGNQGLHRIAASGTWLLPIRATRYLPVAVTASLVALWLALVSSVVWLVWDRTRFCMAKLPKEI